MIIIIIIVLVILLLLLLHYYYGYTEGEEKRGSITIIFIIFIILFPILMTEGTRSHGGFGPVPILALPLPPGQAEAHTSQAGPGQARGVRARLEPPDQARGEACSLQHHLLDSKQGGPKPSAWWVPPKTPALILCLHPAFLPHLSLAVHNPIVTGK